MKLMNIAKCKFIITDGDKKINVKVGDVVDVDDKTANNLLKCYPSFWKNLDIVINRVETKRVEEEKKEEVKLEVVDEAPKAVKSRKK